MKENVFVQYNTDEERIAAFRRMIGMRKEWENRVRRIMAQRTEMQPAQ